MLASRLRAARQAARLTLAAVGARLDPAYTRKNVCKWEHGQTEPSLRTVEQLAKVLDVSPCWLAWGCEHMRNPGMVSSDKPQTQKADVVLINEADHAK